MDNILPRIHGIDHRCRALAALEGETEAITFLVGTQSMKNDNMVRSLNHFSKRFFPKLNSILRTMKQKIDFRDHLRKSGPPPFRCTYLSWMRSTGS